jgi:hypothetical protein
MPNEQVLDSGTEKPKRNKCISISEPRVSKNKVSFGILIRCLHPPLCLLKIFQQKEDATNFYRTQTLHQSLSVPFLLKWKKCSLLYHLITNSFSALLPPPHFVEIWDGDIYWAVNLQVHPIPREHLPTTIKLRICSFLCRAHPSRWQRISSENSDVYGTVGWAARGKPLLCAPPKDWKIDD